jgi:transposase
VVQEVPGASACPRCGAATTPAWGSESAEVLEIEVRAYRRIVRRPRSRPSCGCGCLTGLVTAPAPDALWPRNKLGVSIWVELLLSKFLYGQPTARLLQDWTERGLPIAQGTVTEGLQRLAPLFEPMLEACLDQVRRAAHWHADETRWEGFEDLPGKTGHRWYLWVFKAQQAVVYVLDPSRSSAVPGKVLAGADGGLLSVDRFAAYRKFARCVAGMRLALCWAHQRRDFLRVANDHPDLWAWAAQWVQLIGQLYALHRLRRQDLGKPTSAVFMAADTQLRELVLLMERRREEELAEPELAGPARKVLKVMKSYWPGLIVFIEFPWLDLGRVEMWRGGGRYGIAVSAPFGWRCPMSRTVTPFPHPPRRTGRALLTHPALFRHIKPSRSSGHVQTASGVSAPTFRRGTGRSIGDTPFPVCHCAFATRPVDAAPCRCRCRGRFVPPAPD